MLPQDKGDNWAALLCRMLPDTDTAQGSSGGLMSVLRCLARNRGVLVEAPKYEDARKFKISTIFRGQSSFAQLMTNLKQYLNRKFDASVLHFPQSGPPPIYEPPMTVAQPLPLSEFNRTAACMCWAVWG